MDRILPDQQFTYRGTLGTSAALLTPNSTYNAFAKQVILTNTSASDVTVTITSAEGSPTTEAAIVVSSYDQWVRSYDQGWEFTNGMKASASSGSAVRVQIWGFQKST